MLNGLLRGRRHQDVEKPLRHLPHIFLFEDPHIAAKEGLEDNVKLVRRELVEHTEQFSLEQSSSVRVDLVIVDSLV